MGHRVFNPVYYVFVMSEGQIIGLVWPLADVDDRYTDILRDTQSYLDIHK